MTVSGPKPSVSLFRLFTKMGGWLVLVLGAISLILSLISQSNLGLAKRFEAEGLEATAIVSERFIEKMKGDEGRNKTAFFLVLKFTSEAGQEVTAQQKVSRSDYEKLIEGSEVRLRYLASKPGMVKLTPGQYRSSSSLLQVMALLTGLPFLAGLFVVGGWAVSAVRARRYGLRETAMVQEVRYTGLKLNSRRRLRLIWRDARGREGASILRREAELREFKPGDQIEIYQGVKRSWWIGDVGERTEISP